MTVILDTSALLTVLLDEHGADKVRPHMATAQMSIINLCETYTKLIEAGLAKDDAEDQVMRLGLRIRSFREAHALETAALRPLTRHLGLSLGDRACLALARLNDLPVMTADRLWAELDIGIDIRLIR
ncbi:type II toxin-antitoxin system VapC family toxin [Sphingobium rhizovicinum]|jgi:PIN domain nuclease of toxin-antitoxin system|uniref:Type II toxin-antitoxin system VapC family toxin n=1 Tax=Sphingobium rhizovicinum TaxID=432308 RepID=A0ABV7NI55_9SPHN